MTEALAGLDWQESPPRRRRRRGWGWLIALVVVAGLAVGAWFLGESIARGVVEDAIRQQVVSQLALPPDQEVEVEVGGTIIPQLIAGRLDVVTVSAVDLPLGPTSGDVTVRAAGIPIRGEPVFDAGQGTVVLTADEVSSLLALSPDVPIEDVRFTGTDAAVRIPFSFLGAEIPIDATLTPRAGDGALVLTPQSYEVAGLTLDVDGLRAQFGDLVSAITSDRVVCLADYLPAGLSLQHVAIQDDTLRAQFAIDPRIAVDPALQETGSCA